MRDSRGRVSTTPPPPLPTTHRTTTSPPCLPPLPCRLDRPQTIAPSFPRPRAPLFLSRPRCLSAPYAECIAYRPCKCCVHARTLDPSSRSRHLESATHARNTPAPGCGRRRAHIHPPLECPGSELARKVTPAAASICSRGFYSKLILHGDRAHSKAPLGSCMCQVVRRS